MKILHVIAQLPDRTGSGIYLQNLIKGLDKYDQALVYASQDDFTLKIDGIKKYPVYFKTEKLPFPIVGMSDEMPYESFKYQDMSSSMIEKWSLAFEERLNQVKEDFKADIVISNHLWMLTDIVLKVFENRPVIGIFHGTDLRQAKKNPQIAKAYLGNLNKLSKVVCLSEGVIDSIVDTFGIERDKITSFGAGFNDKIFYCGLKEKNDFVEVVYAGKLSRAKGIYQLINVINSLKDKNIHFTIIGAKSEEQVEEFKKLLEAGTKARILKQISQDELACYFREADIFVLPSFFEGLGLVALEAMACGLRVVSTNISGLREFLGKEAENRELINYVDLPRMKSQDEPFEEDLKGFEDSLREKIISTSKKVKEIKNISENDKVYINSFSWKNLIEKFEKLILEQVNKSNI